MNQRYTTDDAIPKFMRLTVHELLGVLAQRLGTSHLVFLESEFLDLSSDY